MKFTWTDSKRRNAAIITSMFVARGYHENLARAAVVNAAAESNLDAGAVAKEPKGGVSTGLFQVYDQRGKRDLSGYDLTNPADNTRWILTNEKKALDELNKSALLGADVGTLASNFCRLVERPADPDKRAGERDRLALIMYPPEVS